ncbi:ATP-binding protein [Roseibium sp. HPY-6]|uniref:ATP-binding protein n=1 Tax=Roseibium sp. HPY-6 TaxID=3229852 RepID=UPI00338FE773
MNGDNAGTARSDQQDILMAAKAEKVTVRNDLSELQAVYSALESFSRTAGLSDEVRRSMLLVVEELFSNTVSYGYPKGEADEIVVTMALRSRHVELTLTDSGKPFDNSISPDGPVQGEDAESMPVGGLGLFLVHQLAEQVTTKRSGDRNHTIVRLPR